MPNPYYSDVVADKSRGGEGGSNKAQGSTPSTAMPERTADWPGVPGKTGPSRAGGAPTKGKLGPFEVKKQGI